MASKRKKKVSRKKVTVRKKKKVKKATSAKKKRQTVLGVVTHYFPKVNAAVVKLKKPLSVGDRVQFQGHTTQFSQEVKSMQIDHEPIQKAAKGKEIGLEVNERVRTHDVMVPAKKE